MENKHKTFQPYDKVLVRVSKKYPWGANFYSHYSSIIGFHYTTCGTPISNDNILPYEGNEHLLGTTDEPEEEVKLKEGEWVMASDYIEGIKDMYASTGHFLRITRDKIVLTSRSCEYDYQYAIRFSDFNPNNMEETRKHILCVKNGKILKYHEKK